MTDTMNTRSLDFLLVTVHEPQECVLGGFRGDYETTEPACQDPGAARLIAAWLNEHREDDTHGRCCYQPGEACHAYCDTVCAACIGAIITAGAAWAFDLDRIAPGKDPVVDAAKVLYNTMQGACEDD